MMSNNQRSPSGVPAKQKIMAIVFVVIFVVVIWQVIGMFTGGKSKPAPIPQAQPAGMNANAATTTTTTATTGPKPAAQPQVAEATSPKDVELMNIQQETQQKYLSSVNELQVLKVQKDIAETNQAIAAARLATVTSETSMAGLLTRPAGGGEVRPTTTTTTTAAPAAASADTTYAVVSVEMHANKWTAVISYQGKYTTVNVGDFVKPDDYKVTSIDKNGVTLQKEGETKRLTMATSF